MKLYIHKVNRPILITSSGTLILYSEKHSTYPSTGPLQATNPPLTASLLRSEGYFEELKISDAEDLSDHIWMCDESGICTSVASCQVLTWRGAKFVHETTGGSGREIITIHAVVSASGKQVPPFVVYKGKNCTYHGHAEDLRAHLTQ